MANKCIKMEAFLARLRPTNALVTLGWSAIKNLKLQYLGNSKDSFTWDYHDYLMSELRYTFFNIVLMLTPDDGGNDGNLHPSLFPARNEVVDFCHVLRQSRSIKTIKALPVKSSASYTVAFHKDNTHITNRNRDEYFAGFNDTGNQIRFLVPDNGFEPEKSFSEKHVRQNEITRILKQISDESVISVFQHRRRKLFPDYFALIRERTEFGYLTAIY